MPPARSRLTIGRLMVAVAFSAVLIPFPLEISLFVAVLVAVFAILDFFFGDWIDILIASHPVAFAILAASCPITMAIYMNGPRPDGKSAALAILFGGLTAANVAGPFSLGWRIRRREPIAGGHLLWAWLGPIWILSILIIFSPAVSHGRPKSSHLIEGCIRLTIAVAVLLALYGKRPIGKRATEAHFAGWVLAGIDLIVWGWYASAIYQ